MSAPVRVTGEVVNTIEATAQLQPDNEVAPARTFVVIALEAGGVPTGRVYLTPLAEAPCN